ncbi:MAG TPA: hypothetical protein VHH73_00210 [Verrucomicrobiae bacterium]|nr:hypothetical protein [Verrucomicrobiae bacterium]
MLAVGGARVDAGRRAVLATPVLGRGLLALWGRTGCRDAVATA